MVNGYRLEELWPKHLPKVMATSCRQCNTEHSENQSLQAARQLIPLQTPVEAFVEGKWLRAALQCTTSQALVEACAKGKWWQTARQPNTSQALAEAFAKRQRLRAVGNIAPCRAG